MAPLQLRKRQHEVASRMLELDQGIQESGETEAYKLLVLDEFSHSMMSPLMRMDELRKHGVTLHMLIGSTREPVADVPAVYFVRPTEANIEAIARDVGAGLYDAFHLNFTSTVPKHLLERLASNCAKSGGLKRVSSVFDRNVEFVALEPNLFSLEDSRAYAELNDPTAKDESVEGRVKLIAERLFCACATMSAMPIVRCPRGGPAEMVASELTSMLKEFFKSKGSEQSGFRSSQQARPLLCLFDRNFELATPLQHPWSYQGLVKDVLGMKLNKVDFSVPSRSQGGSVNAQAGKKSYDLDMDRDPFWQQHAASEFPKAAEDVDNELKQYRQEAENVTKQAEGAGAESGQEQGTEGLMSAVNSIPRLQERKAILDKHTNMATAILDQVKSRKIDAFNRLEQQVLESRQDKQAVQELLDGSEGSAEDKLRLALIYCLACEQPPSASHLESLESSLRSAGASSEALAYVRKLRSLDASLKASKQSSHLPSSSDIQSATNLLDWADRLYGQGISAVTRGVSSLLQGGSRQPAITRAVEILMDNRPNSGCDDFAHFDPKPASAHGAHPGNLPSASSSPSSGAYRDAIVFVVGGGCYLEHHSLQEMAKRAPPGSPKRVIYGATEMLSGSEFISQLAELGRKS